MTELLDNDSNTTKIYEIFSSIPSGNVSSDSSAKSCVFPLAHGIPIVLLNTIFSIFGTVGNILIVLAVLKTPKLRRISNFLLLSLALADLLVATFAQPMQIITVAVKTFGHFCVPPVDYAYDVIANFSCSCSLFHLAAISVDRAIIIAKPHNYQTIMGKYGLRAMVASCWGIALLFVCIRVQFPGTLFLSVAFIIMSYLTITASYTVILFEITKERVNRSKHPNDLRAISRDARMERRVAGTIAIVIVAFSICWFPLLGFYISMKRGLLRTLSGVPYMWIRTLLLINSSMNFMIYSFRIDHFRSAYKKIIRRWVRKASGWMRLSNGTSSPPVNSSSRCSTLDKMGTDI